MGRIFVLGDIHGDYSCITKLALRLMSSNYQPTKEDTLILLGDTGINYFNDSRDTKLKKHLSKLPFTYFIIRGNHDRRAMDVYNENEWTISNKYVGETYVEKSFPDIHYAHDDAAIYDFNGLRALCVPGAYSVDKFYRLQTGKNWFENEQLTEYEMERCRNLCAMNNYKFDIVLSHTCPSFFVPTDLFISSIDQSMVDTAMERFLGSLEYGLDYKAWFWGHYHAFRDYPRDDGRKKLMLFNDCAVDIEEYVNNNEVNKI